MATETLARDGSRPRPPLAIIVRIDGAPATPSEHLLETGACVLGSGPAADIIVNDPAVSRTHVELSLVPEGIAVHDLGSRNGTFYLGQRLERMILTPGSAFTIGRATVRIEADVASLRAGAEGTRESYGALVGRSSAMRRVFAILERLEGSLVPVLVEGESGVGKELVARALHDHSSVATGPFVALNCGGFARELLASELFGHKKGAFTGATENRRGALESADGGTLFLDELGEMPADVQPLLLRFLESGEVRAVGSDAVRNVRVRIVAATNRSLEEMVSAATFREDLFFRLAVVRLWIPPLRERREDIEPIARRLAANLGLDPPTALLERLRLRPWTGNVRELRNVLTAYGVLGELAESAEHQPRRKPTGGGLGDLVDVDRPYLELKEEIIEQFTRLYMERMLERTHGNQAEAARLSGLDRTYLGRLLSRYGMTKT
jgi:DNA-binding NtrC family response regulator